MVFFNSLAWPVNSNLWPLGSILLAIFSTMFIESPNETLGLPKKFVEYLKSYLLIFPGFITDIIGFLLIFPLSRKLIFDKFVKKINKKKNKENNFIDGEFEDIDDDNDRKI